MFKIFNKHKKLSEDKLANIVVNGLDELIENGFSDVCSLVNYDPAFEYFPDLTKEESDHFYMVVLSANLLLIPKQFNHYSGLRIIDLIYSKASKNTGKSKEKIKAEVRSIQSLCYRLNHPSKNVLYGMSKAFFHQYELYAFQYEYFRNLKTINPLLLKRLNEIFENFLWNWDAFLEEYKIVEPS